MRKPRRPRRAPLGKDLSDRVLGLQAAGHGSAEGTATHSELADNQISLVLNPERVTRGGLDAGANGLHNASSFTVEDQASGGGVGVGVAVVLTGDSVTSSCHEGQVVGAINTDTSDAVQTLTGVHRTLGGRTNFLRQD